MGRGGADDPPSGRRIARMWDWFNRQSFPAQLWICAALIVPIVIII